MGENEIFSKLLRIYFGLPSLNQAVQFAVSRWRLRLGISKMAKPGAQVFKHTRSRIVRDSLLKPLTEIPELSHQHKALRVKKTKPAPYQEGLPREQSRGQISEGLRQAVQKQLDQGESIHALARRAGVASPVLNRWVRSTRGSIRLRVADRLAAALGLGLAAAPAKPAKRTSSAETQSAPAASPASRKAPRKPARKK